MATWTIAPDFSSEVDEKPRVLSSQFGDGYQQRAGDGINIRAQVWNLTFASRTSTERDAILAFLRARNGIESFDWTAPDGVVGKYICREWTYSPKTAANNTLSAKFEQVFGE